MTDTTAQGTADSNGSAVPASPIAPAYTYALLPNSTSIMRSDNVSFPPNPSNADYQTYQAWLSAGNTPTPAPAPSPNDLIAHAQAVWQATLAKGQSFNVSASGSATLVLCDGTNDTRADLALLALFGQANPSGTKTWLDNNGKTTVLTGSELVTLATVAGNWVANTYPALAQLIAEIEASPPTITTMAQIDAYAWPTT